MKPFRRFLWNLFEIYTGFAQALLITLGLILIYRVNSQVTR